MTAGENLCRDHTYLDPVSGNAVCKEHRQKCSTCQQLVADTTLEDGTCETCQSLGDGELPTEVQEELSRFRKIRCGINERYVVAHGSQLLGSNELVVLDKRDWSVVHRKRTGLFAKLTGVSR
jgi:hypothetical protein